MTPEELEKQVLKNTVAIKTVSDSLVNYVQNQYLDNTNKSVSANTSDIEKLRNDLGDIQNQINLQNRIEYLKDTNIVDATKLDLLQYDGNRWSNVAANKVVTGLLGKLVDLQDVKVEDVRNDEALAWDSELQKWTNKNLNTEIYDDIFISKIKPDSTPHEVWFKDSAVFGQEGFASGLTGFGGKIDKWGHAELDSLTLRRFLEVPELRYNRVEIQLGDKWNAPGAGVIESVEQLDQYTGTITLKLEEGEYGAVSMGDLCMGIFHSENTVENAESDEDDGMGNRKFAGFYTVYFEVTNILDAQNKKFGYKLRPVDEYWTMTYHPCAQMNFVAYGNKTNVDRQTSCYSTRTYTRYLVNQNTWDQRANNIAMQFGDLSNLNIFGYEMEGYSAYLNSVYFTGKITQVKPSGEEVLYANDRGAWEPDTHYDYYDRVSVLGYLWLCVNDNGSDTKPSEDNPDWLMQVSKGDQGEGLILRRSEWKPRVEYCNESEVSPTVQPLRYLDIALVKDLGAETGYKVYKCIYTRNNGKHTSNNDNAPGTAGGAEYWEELAQNVDSIYTDLIIAKNAKLDFMTGNALRVGYYTGNTVNDFVVRAGITGEGGDDSDAIRIWAGTTEENRANADFRVTQGGKLHARNATIEGNITASTGTLGTLYLTGYIDGTNGGSDGMMLFPSYIKFKWDYRELILGTVSNLGFGYFGRMTSNATDEYVYNNAGLYMDLTGGLNNNLAMYGNGDISMNGNVVGYSYRVAEFTEASNTIQRQTYASRMLIVAPYGSCMIGLPEYSIVESKLGINQANWTVSMTITYVPTASSPNVRIYGRQNSSTNQEYPILYNQNGGRVEYVDINQGDTFTFTLIKEYASRYYAMIENLSN